MKAFQRGPSYRTEFDWLDTGGRGSDESTGQSMYATLNYAFVTSAYKYTAGHIPTLEGFVVENGSPSVPILTAHDRANYMRRSVSSKMRGLSTAS